MTQETLWIGTTSKFVSATLPDLPLDAPLSGFGEEMGSVVGGRAAVQTFGQAKRFDFSFGLRPVSELAVYKRLRQGSFGTGLIYFPDPIAQRENLFAPHWAEPGLLETGDWPNIYDTAPTGYANVSSNSYDQPLRKPTWAITNTNTAPTGAASKFIIPIPPDQTLRLGVSGAATGVAVVRVVAYNIAAGSSAGSNLTLLTDTSSTRLNATFAGSSYDYVEVYFMRTSASASTLTITSMLAQLWPTSGATPTLTGNHRAGEGHTGCRFTGAEWSETSRVASDDGERNYRSLAFSLVEVGAWR